MAEKKDRQGSTPEVVAQWNEYFQDGQKIENWQRLMEDLDVKGDFGSKSACRKALKRVWVNIYDFLEAAKLGRSVKRFGSQNALSSYTLKTGKIYPKRYIQEGSPLRSLMAHIFVHGGV